MKTVSEISETSDFAGSVFLADDQFVQPVNRKFFTLLILLFGHAVDVECQDVALLQRDFRIRELRVGENPQDGAGFL